MWQRRMSSPWQVSLSSVLALALALVFAPWALSAARSEHDQPRLVGPKMYYLALGDSLAYGYQPDLDWANGYASDFFSDLKKRGVRYADDLACVSESSVTMIDGGCPYAFLDKFAYTGPQLRAAVNYLHRHAGEVSPVTLDIGANDMLADFNQARCAVNPRWRRDLATIDTNLRDVILPQLSAALTVNGRLTGDLLLLNYYNPYRTVCPAVVPYIQALNQDLAVDADGQATLVDVFSALANPRGGDMAVSASNVCLYTWICSASRDVHPNRVGYAAITSAIERTVNY